MTDTRLMSTRELAEYLGVPRNTIYQWRHNGDGPRAIRVGRHLRFRRADIDEWLERNAEPGPAAPSW